MTKETIHVEHPEYRRQRAMRRRYRDLYAGGEQFVSNASDYLVRRQKEPGDVYAERLYRVFYENYVGSIVDWYAATLFRREPAVQAACDDEATQVYLNEFAEDCDLQGTRLAGFVRQMLIDAMVQGSSYALVDFPRLAYEPANRAEEDLLGASHGYVTPFRAEDLINWQRDERGALEWVVLRTTESKQSASEAGEWATETRWLYFDRTSFAVYERQTALGGASQVVLADEGRHALAGWQKVPLVELRLSQGLWLLNKAGSLQLEHFNKSNALSWALTMGLFAMPVIYSDREFNQVVGESYYIQLGPEDKFGWTEPQGTVYQIAADNLSRLQEEIYRVCYLIHQSGASGAGQSGLSKQRDFAITQEVLRAYGDAAKDTMRRLLRMLLLARGETAAVDVSGLDEFDIGDFGTELADAKTLLGLGIESPTMRQQVYKRLAQKYLSDLRQEVKDQIAREIDAAHG